MQKKIVQVIESFERCQFQDALHQIEHIEKKAQSKKKVKLSSVELIDLTILKCGSLAATSYLHKAHSIMIQQFHNVSNITFERAFLFLQVCHMTMDQRIPKFIEQLQELHKDKALNIKRFLIGERMFSKLGRIYLKAYTQSKKIQDSLQHIYMEYFNSLHSQNLIKYQRDPTYKQININLKMVEMFLLKLVQQSNDKQLNTKFMEGLVNIRLRIAINGGKSKEARQIFTNHIDSIPQKFRFLRSIRELPLENQTNKIFYINNMLKIFHINLNFQTYTPLYDYYDQFLDYIYQQYIKCSNNQSIPLILSVLQPTQIYQYKLQPLHQLNNYYCSLYTEYNNLLKSVESVGKHDYYKISIKGLLLQLIKIQNFLQKPMKLLEFLHEYRKQFGKTFTYPKEMFRYREIIEDKLPITFTKDDDILMWEINRRKIYTKTIPHSLQQLMKVWEEYEYCYQTNKQKVEKNRVLEKGQKYASDEFIIIISDLVRKFIQSNKLIPSLHQSVCMRMISLLEKASSLSPYNYDIKLRLMIFYDQMGYHQELVEVFLTLDIKSVQFETLGFFVLKPILQYGVFKKHDGILVRMLRSYQQNFRQCAQYGLKAIERLSFNQVQQYLSYESNSKRSYNHVILLFCIYLMYRKQIGSQYYLELILKIINTQSLTLNCDFKIIQNQLFHQRDYIDFYGIYNNSNLLKQEVQIRLTQQKLLNKKQYIDNLNIQLTKWMVSDLLTFENFQIFQRRINCKQGIDLNYQYQYSFYLDLYCHLMVIRVSILKWANSVFQKVQQNKQFTNDNIIAQLQSLKNKFITITWRQQIKYISFIRIQLSDAIPLLQLVIQQAKNNKKLKERKKIVIDLSSQVIGQVIQIITDWKNKDHEQIEKYWMSQQCIKRDQMIQKMSIMSIRQAKKQFNIK